MIKEVRQSRWFNYGVILLAVLIPFQPRLYKSLRAFSASLIQTSWSLPAYFEIHFDVFVADFLIIALIGMALRGKLLFWEGERKYLTLFLLAALVSIFGSSLPTYPLQYWRWMHLALPAGLFFVLGHRPQIPFTALAKGVVMASVIEALIAIVQYFVQHSLGLKMLGEPTLIARNFVGSTVPIADGSRWIFDRLFHVVRDHPFILRASGTLPHPNILGGVMVFGLLMTYYLYGLGKKRGWLAAIIALQVFCLFITYSRSALYMWVLMTLLWIAVTSWKDKKLSSLIGVAGGCFLLCGALLYPQLFERGGVVSYTAVSQVSDIKRLALHEIGWKMIQAHPWMGVGFNSYMLAFQTMFEKTAAEIAYVHNVYLHIAAEIGIPGLMAFLAFSWVILMKGWRLREQPAVLTSACILLAFLGIGMVDYYPLCDPSSRVIFFLMAGILRSHLVEEPLLVLHESLKNRA